MSADGIGRAGADSDYPIGGVLVHDCPECGEPCDCEQTVCDHLCKVYGDSEAAQADEARETEASEGES